MFKRREIVLHLCLIALAAGTPARAADRPSETADFFEKYKAPEGSSFFLSQVPKTERGDRMVIRGVVIDIDRKPIANASVYIYHTDAEGRYDPQEARPGMGSDNPRLHGFLRTDSVGRYVYGSVRPAPYPTTPLPAHVHFVVQADGFRPRAFEFWFEGDPMITPAHLEAQAKEPARYQIRPAMRDSTSVWQITNDIVLERM